MDLELGMGLDLVISIKDHFSFRNAIPFINQFLADVHEKMTFSENDFLSETVCSVRDFFHNPKVQGRIKVYFDTACTTTHYSK